MVPASKTHSSLHRCTVPDLNHRSSRRTAYMREHYRPSHNHSGWDAKEPAPSLRGNVFLDILVHRAPCYETKYRTSEPLTASSSCVIPAKRASTVIVFSASKSDGSIVSRTTRTSAP